VRDVAALSGTSIAVVSYVINDGPRPVADATKTKVLEAIETLAYRPNRIAQALRSRRSGQLGLVVPDSSSEFFVQLVQDVQRAAFARDQLVLVGSSGYDAHCERAYFEAFVDAGVDAIIVATVSDDPPAAELVETTRVIWFHHRPKGATGPFVDMDNENAGRTAMEHLLSHGSVRPLVVTGPNDVGPVGLRLAGALRAASALGLDDADVGLIRTDFSRYAAATALASRGTDYDGVLTTTDEHGIGVLAALGRAVPDRIGVVSVDGTKASSCLDPSLTTMQPPIAEMAEQAVALALDTDNAPRADHRFNTELRLGRSCGCLPAVDMANAGV